MNSKIVELKEAIGYLRKVVQENKRIEIQRPTDAYSKLLIDNIIDHLLPLGVLSFDEMKEKIYTIYDCFSPCNLRIIRKNPQTQEQIEFKNASKVILQKFLTISSKSSLTLFISSEEDVFIDLGIEYDKSFFELSHLKSFVIKMDDRGFWYDDLKPTSGGLRFINYVLRNGSGS